nr:CDP-diacylglycerol-glycerol-3-phosphate 3-phosphatidyltransferase [Ipomoea batatas]GMC74356.1 CDP-diacylglycerol-glycerol-3-phosphate 3-phosphatidyltransferase [Ipomoea batatas]GMC75877.1 CDP-diacylglycerol-glycerol-3-phosphate 3-phosphatidyltransferase [Ipomoea batatas]
MERKNTYESSWADQWDYNQGPSSEESNSKKSSNSLGGGMMKGKYGQKVEEGVGKTKAAAATGVKKVKEGTSVGFRWIKDKYQKTTQKD